MGKKHDEVEVSYEDYKAWLDRSKPKEQPVEEDHTESVPKTREQLVQEQLLSMVGNIRISPKNQ
jgi:hypothetical protein